MSEKIKTLLSRLPRVSRRDGLEIVYERAEITSIIGKTGMYYVSGKMDGCIRFSEKTIKKKNKYNEIYLDMGFELPIKEIANYIPLIIKR